MYRVSRSLFVFYKNYNQQPSLVLLVKVLDGHLVHETVGDSHKFTGNLLLQLRLHRLDHLAAVLLQEQVGRVR